MNKSISGKQCTFQQCKYPNLELYMIRHELSLREFARQCGIQPSTMHRILHGKTDIQKSNIDKILVETGMSYEVCFKERTWD